MGSTWRTIAANLVLGMAAATAAGSAEAQTRPLSLTVVIHDYAALDKAVVERAKGVVGTIYRDIDVQVNWWSTDRFAAEMTGESAHAVSPTVIHVRLLRSSPAVTTGGELGMAVQGSWRASALVGRVEYVASQGGLDIADLLGHVIAHEIGHLLLPPNSHSATGLMAADLDLFRVAHGGLRFDQRQASVIRSRISAMSELR